jgi:hypothetical protein
MFNESEQAREDRAGQDVAESDGARALHLSRKGWVHGAVPTPAGPSDSFLAVLEFSMEAMLLETAHVWSPGKGFFLRGLGSH